MKEEIDFTFRMATRDELKDSPTAVGMEVLFHRNSIGFIHSTPATNDKRDEAKAKPHAKLCRATKPRKPFHWWRFLKFNYGTPAPVHIGPS